MRNMDGTAPEVLGILDVNGATCPSCAFTIERAGRRVAGVRDIRVDVNSRQIRVRYDGRPQTLGGVQEIVRRLGYAATVREGGSSGR